MGLHFWICLVVTVLLAVSVAFNVVLHGKVCRFEGEATIDILTGLRNRRGFDQAFLDSVRRTRRDNVPFTVILFDLNGFKPYNDRFGHQAGDLMLQAFARLLEKVFARDSDVKARWGGDEFAVVLHNLPGERVPKTLERLLLYLGKLEQQFGVSASFGVITEVGLREGIPAEEQARRVFEAADSALFRAKGRKTAEVFPYEVASPTTDIELKP